MAGRGRGATLPAWMTSGNLQPLSATTEPTLSVQASASVPPAPVTERPAASFNPPAPAPKVAAAMSLPPKPQGFQQQYTSIAPPVGVHPMGGPPLMPMLGGGGFTMGGMPNQSFMPPMHMHNSGGFNPPPFGFQPVTPYATGQHGLPMSGAAPPAPPMPRLPPGAAPAAIDPTNDVSCWAEHESDAGLKYWYNRVTMVSTYDKPFCLKTPEERSIPPCPWKEYTAADDKKYYSNGKESTWIMPEEYRVWKEKMDAIEQKRVVQAASQATAEAERLAELRSGNRAARAGPASNSGSGVATSGGSAAAANSVQYASAAEAAEAFKDMLAEKKISTIAKMREVQELCQSDERWDALKTQGEKKQALAEYQTKRLKLEKEQQKLKARKHRDAFLLMLAENTDIDARTRWKDAVTILQDDPRYKNVEDPRDREELFEEFIVELEKKEKEDKRKARDEALAAFTRLLREAGADGQVNRKSIWVDSKKLFVDVMVRSDFRSLEEADFRRAFQSYTAELEEEFQLGERRRRAELERTTAASQAELRALLEEMARDGKLTGESRWKDCLEHDYLAKSAVMDKLRALYPPDEDRGGNALHSACRSVFDTVQSKVYDQYRLDRRLVRDLLAKHGWKVRHDSSFAEFKAFALKLARVRETEETGSAEGGGHSNGNGTSSGGQGSAKVVVEPVAAGTARHEEDGEEVDEQPFEQLRTMMLERPAALSQIFSELHRKAVADHEEEQHWIRKVEKKFNSVLAENFYLQEHASIPWDEAKKALQRRSVYDELGKSDRRRLFAEHMAALAAGAKLPAAEVAPDGGRTVDGGRDGRRGPDRRDDEREREREREKERGASSRRRSRSRSTKAARPEPVRRGEGREVRDVSKDRLRRHSKDREGERDRGERDRDREKGRDRHRDDRGPEDEERRKRARGGEAY